MPWGGCKAPPARIALAVRQPTAICAGLSVSGGAERAGAVGTGRFTASQVLVIVGKQKSKITLNLKAPLVINLPQRLDDK